jgi:hypothetical protein
MVLEGIVPHVRSALPVLLAGKNQARISTVETRFGSWVVSKSDEPCSGENQEKPWHRPIVALVCVENRVAERTDHIVGLRIFRPRPQSLNCLAVLLDS